MFLLLVKPVTSFSANSLFNRFLSCRRNANDPREISFLLYMTLSFFKKCCYQIKAATLPNKKLWQHVQNAITRNGAAAANLHPTWQVIFPKIVCAFKQLSLKLFSRCFRLTLFGELSNTYVSVLY